MIYALFVVLICIAAVLMIVIVLIQESKGGGLASNFSASNSILGVRKTTDVVEKTTWGLAIAMVLFSVICAYVAPRAVSEQSVMENVSTQTPLTNPTNVPGFGTSKQTQPAQGEGATKSGESNKTSTTPQAPKLPAK